jgi:hypothetical protein
MARLLTTLPVRANGRHGQNPRTRPEKDAVGNTPAAIGQRLLLVRRFNSLVCFSFAKPKI